MNLPKHHVCWRCGFAGYLCHSCPKLGHTWLGDTSNIECNVQVPTSKSKKKKKRVQKKAAVKGPHPPGPSTNANVTTAKVPKEATEGTNPLVPSVRSAILIIIF